MKLNISTIYMSVDCYVSLIPRNSVKGAKSRRRTRTVLIERH